MKQNYKIAVVDAVTPIIVGTIEGIVQFQVMPFVESLSTDMMNRSATRHFSLVLMCLKPESDININKNTVRWKRLVKIGRRYLLYRGIEPQAARKTAEVLDCCLVGHRNEELLSLDCCLVGHRNEDISVNGK